MRIRITGTRPETEATCRLLARVLEVRERSGFYPNRGSSQLGRIYLDVTPPTAPEER